MRNENEYNYRTLQVANPYQLKRGGWIVPYDNSDRLELITIFIPQYNKVCNVCRRKIQVKNLQNVMDARWEWCQENLKGYDVITYCLPTTLNFYREKRWSEGHTSTLTSSKI